MSEPNEAEISFRKVEAESGQHAAGDKRKPTAYRVLVDGAVIGIVRSHSEESWRQLPSGVRYSMRGYVREWRGWLTGNTNWRGDVMRYDRQRCAEVLAEMAQQDGSSLSEDAR